MKQNHELDQKIKSMLSKIEQQRLGLINDFETYSKIMAPYDRGWIKITSTNKYFILASGVLAFYVIRHPVRVFMGSRRILKAWSFMRLIRSFF
ncbi:YqjK-like family protein [Candidatus Williamhamiltonella defendens]|uniref:YqjK-like family protein n=1 Tax=Candidatus Williamhamiltonella defendens TaxID=138072 RepID=UPI001583F9DD|nr:YqjK-like family protein [Candidatus Hamiltonella defensa]